MNLAALYHSASGATAYPLDTHRLRVLLRAAVDDLDGGTVLWRDRYAPPAEPDQRCALERVATDGVSDYWAATLTTDTRRVWYTFCLRSGREIVWLGEAGPAPRRLTSEYAGFQFPYLCTADMFRQPAWLDGITFYHIFPDRFRNGDPANDPPRRRLRWGDRPIGGEEHAGGDLEGIRQGLSHLGDLGIGAFYCTPIFRASTNHKYDIANYYRVDPGFGTNEQLVTLVTEAHARGIRVMLDAVFVDSGTDFFAFRDVRRHGPASRYVSWYHRIDSFPVDPSIPNYETFATGLGIHPKLNTADPACAEYLLRVGEYWLRKADIDGWRLDVANEIDHVFWRRFRERVKRIKPDAWILGEVWHDATPWLSGGEFDAVMNYPFWEAALQYLQGQRDAREFDQALQRLWYRYPAPVLSGLLNLVGSHDTPRVRTVLGPERARLATVLLLTSPGVPMVFYGDEIGLEGGPDHDCRRCMEWDPEKWDQQTFELHRRLIYARRKRPWLNDGAWETLVADPVSCAYAFRRSSHRMLGALPSDGPEQSLWVAVNPSPAPVDISLSLANARSTFVRNLLTDEELIVEDPLRLSLPPYAAVVLAQEEPEK
jgi:cyclomaltodextrinase